MDWAGDVYCHAVRCLCKRASELKVLFAVTLSVVTFLRKRGVSCFLCENACLWQLVLINDGKKRGATPNDETGAHVRQRQKVRGEAAVGQDSREVRCDYRVWELECVQVLSPLMLRNAPKCLQ